jgi:dihydroorotase
VLSRVPAEIGRLEGYAAPFEVGSPAHLTLYDPAASGVFDASRLRGMSVNSPYLGRELPGRVVATIHGGLPTVLDGELREPEEVARG